MLKKIVVLFALVTLALANFSRAENQIDYFPLKKGNWWVFEGSITGGKNVRVKYEITDEKDGKFLFVMKIDNRDQNVDGYFQVKDNYLEITQNGQTDRLLALPVKAGTEWESGADGKKTRVEEVKALESFEPKLENCARVVCRIPNRGTSTVWFAPEIGWVMMTTEIDGREVNHLKLVDYFGNHKGVR